MLIPTYKLARLRMKGIVFAVIRNPNKTVPEAKAHAIAMGNLLEAGNVDAFQRSMKEYMGDRAMFIGFIKRKSGELYDENGKLTGSQSRAGDEVIPLKTFATKFTKIA